MQLFIYYKITGYVSAIRTKESHLYHSKFGSKRKEEKRMYKLYYIESIERKEETHYI